MKTKWIFVLVIFFSLLWLNPLKVSAAEIVSYDVDILMTTYYYNADGTIYEGYPQKEIVAQYDSFSPMYVYYYQTSDGPHIGDDDLQYFVVSQYKFDERCVEIVKDSTSWYVYCWYSSTGYANPNKGYRELNITADNLYRLKQGYDNQGFYTAFINDTLDYNVAIDWDNPVYNETIGYLQNVMLKEDGLTHKDFEITWANNNGQYMNDNWRIQIGYHTRFQESLFGDKRLYTDLDYINWDDEIYYRSGKWSCNVDELYEVIPNCNHPMYTGNFYLRIIHIDDSTGIYEYGPWGQLSWVINKSGDDGGRFVFSEYVTIKTSNVLDKDGVTDFYDEEYKIDTDSDTGQKYIINTANGSIDSSSTDIYNSIYNDTGELDLTKAGDFFISGIVSLSNSLKDFPSLLEEVVSFLPLEITLILGLSIVVIILCRIFGR